MIKSGMYLEKVKSGYKVHLGSTIDVLQYAKKEE